MAVTNDDLRFLGFACDALDQDPDAALRMPRNMTKTDKQYVAVEKGLLREMIERCRQTPPEDNLFDMTGTVARAGFGSKTCVELDCMEVSLVGSKRCDTHHQGNEGDKARQRDLALHNATVQNPPTEPHHGKPGLGVCNHWWHHEESMLPSCPGCGGG